MTRAIHNVKERLEKEGWECHFERDTLREVFWLAAEPPHGSSWNTCKEEVWDYAKKEFGLRTNVREKDTFFIIEDTES